VKQPGPVDTHDSVFLTATVVRDAWSWLILREAIFHDVRRFNAFVTRLGIPRQALHDRLGQLVTGGLLERRLRELPGHISEYVLTERGRDFFGCLATMRRWGEQWCVDDRVKMSKTKHLSCGGRFEAVLQCSECREVIDARAVDVKLGRGARAELRAAARSGAQRHRDPGLNLLERERACPIARTLRVMGDWWSGLVIREAFLGTRRFDEFERRLGIAPNVLSERLARLVDTGVLERRAYQDRPLRHEYRLTRKGLALYPVPLAMLTWGDRWMSNGKPMLRLTHRTCGKRFTALLACGRCAQTAECADVAFASISMGEAKTRKSRRVRRVLELRRP
jgi:DNA-binding HxlR family transcriptional regulator